MSYFSEALASHMERAELTNLTLANLTDLNDSDISRWKRGVGSPPSDKALGKILPAVPFEVALHLCICWLKDETPEKMRSHIVIQPARLAPAADLTREDWQQALDFFLQGCEHNSLMRATLVGLHRLMTKETDRPSKSPAPKPQPTPSQEQQEAPEPLPSAEEKPFKITRLIGKKFDLPLPEGRDVTLNETPEPPAEADLKVARKRIEEARRKGKK